MTEFEVGWPHAELIGIAAGPDGRVWFADRLQGAVGSIATDGTDARRVSLGDGSGPSGIVAGPDGNLWVTETDANRIARVSPAGEVTHFPLPRFMAPLGITAGPDGNVWFAGSGGNVICRITAERRRDRVSAAGRRQFPDQHRERAGRRALVHGVERASHRPPHGADAMRAATLRSATIAAVRCCCSPRPRGAKRITRGPFIQNPDADATTHDASSGGRTSPVTAPSSTASPPRSG